MHDDGALGHRGETRANDNAATGGIAIDSVFENLFVVETDAEFFFGGPFEPGEQIVSAISGGIGEGW